MDFAQAIDRIQDLWHGREEGRICSALLHHLADVDQLPHCVPIVLLRDLGEHTGGASESGVAGAIGYLLGADLRFLEMALEYPLGDGSFVPVTRAAFQQATTTGYLAHPVTGELDHQYDHHVIVKFPLSRQARELLADHRAADRGDKPSSSSRISEFVQQRSLPS